jgi:hypothetical protein
MEFQVLCEFLRGHYLWHIKLLIFVYEASYRLLFLYHIYNP